MSTQLDDLSAFLAGRHVALVEVADARGSTPREAGVWMLVSFRGIYGTIGGGQLEYMAIDKARQMLTGNEVNSEILSIPLGPEIGQCCGGRVELSIRRVNDALRGVLMEEMRREADEQPRVYVFGAGHVGRALAIALAPLPVHTIIVETREAELATVCNGVEKRLLPIPEDAVRAARPGSAFIVLTHDHALDFLIVAEALNRQDAAYVGMIGSVTKKVTFRNWYCRNAGGTVETFEPLVSPIGGDAVKDKRPAVIAALVAAEVMTVLASAPADMKIPARSWN